MVFSSDYMISERITNSLERAGKQSQIIFLNDVNCFTKQIQGKAQD
jgi:hypothetical protein